MYEPKRYEKDVTLALISRFEVSKTTISNMLLAERWCM
jgi:hypothetical protein